MNDFIERSLRLCGGILLDLTDKGSTNGIWEGDQFKAEADRIAHEFLSNQIKLSFPDIPIVSEEDEVSINQNHSKYFMIDPIDGTASFAHGFSGWVTQMAYMENEIPIRSGIYVPVTNEYFEAEKNQGAFCNKKPLTIGSQGETINSVIDNYPQAEGITLELVNDFNIKDYIESGSIALKICRIADNTADVFFKDMNPRDWDLAAPKLVLEEAGGVLSDAVGGEVIFGQTNRAHHGLIAARNTSLLNKVLNWYSLRE